MTRLENILVIAPAWVGDMVMTQSLFKLLKSRHPHANIDVVVPPWSREVLERMDEVRHIYPLEVRHGRLNLLKRWRLAKRLRANGYDKAIIMPRSYKSAIIPFLAGIPIRTGWVGECRFILLTDARLLRPQFMPLMVSRLVALGLEKDEPLPSEYEYPNLVVTPKQQQATQKALQLELDSRPILALCPGAEYGSAKRWPERHFAQLAQQMIEKNWRVFILGSQNDVPVAARVQDICGGLCTDFTGRTSLSQAIDLLSLTTAVVSNDSGLMHIAASLNKPMVALFGSSAPNYTPPLSAMAKIIYLARHCSPCFKRTCPYGHRACLEDISPKSVMSALEELTTISIQFSERVTPFRKKRA